ncbi:hypothetical protein MFLO_12391 [Listeria floridensis FSL S10-1187]|uniref:Uncharacterized protein n=1 Tax=Listeria floridensis FSL S10-1187 TaxID=1265817 RepID=A0ABP3AVK4_9LIST|nr:hypothetical protein MFLO_12391 [Listeria floridensis FSL S10-1187]
MKTFSYKTGLKEKDPCGNMSLKSDYAQSVVHNQLNFNPSLKFKQAFSRAEYLWALDLVAKNAHEPCVQHLCKKDTEQALAIIILMHRQRLHAL